MADVTPGYLESRTRYIAEKAGVPYELIAPIVKNNVYTGGSYADINGKINEIADRMASAIRLAPTTKAVRAKNSNGFIDVKLTADEYQAAIYDQYFAALSSSSDPKVYNSDKIIEKTIATSKEIGAAASQQQFSLMDFITNKFTLRTLALVLIAIVLLWLGLRGLVEPIQSTARKAIA